VADRILLDWRDKRHSLPAPRPCRCCTLPSWSCDDDGTPCHKMCAEKELTEGRAMTREPASWKDNPEMQSLRERLRNERIENAKPQPATPIRVDPW
jgi:hypothetical protein